MAFDVQIRDPGGGFNVVLSTPAGGDAGNPSIRSGGAWNKTTKVKRKASGTMGDVDTVARVGGSWTGV